MDFTLSSDQEALKDGVRKLCEGRFAMDRVRSLADVGGVDRDLWRELGDAGVFSLRLPEDDGGAGLCMPEAALVFDDCVERWSKLPRESRDTLRRGLPCGASASSRVALRRALRRRATARVAASRYGATVHVTAFVKLMLFGGAKP